MTDLSDEELLARTIEDPDAFGVFYRRHVGELLAFFGRRTGDSQLALDLCAETFVRALEHVEGFGRKQSPAVAWLFVIAHNLLRDSYRRNRVDDSARRRLGFERMTVTDTGFEHIEALIDSTDRLAAAQADETLTAKQGTAVFARVLADESYEQIAERLDCSTQVARQHVSRGLRNLKRSMEGKP